MKKRNKEKKKKNERQEYAYFELFAYALPNFLRTPCK
jgi:hypothetical protein